MDKSSVTIQDVKKQKMIDKFVSFKPSKKHGYETVIQINSEGGKGVTVHSGTTSKTFEQNTVPILNDICNERHDVKRKGKYSESLGKPDKQNNVINHEKSDDKEAVKESVKISGISTVSEKQNTVKVIELSKKNNHLEAQDSSKLLLHAFDICTFQERVNSKMTDYQKYGLIKNVFKPDQFFSFPVTKRNFVFSWTDTFPWLCHSRWEEGAYCLQCVLFGATYPDKKLTNFFF